MINTERKHTQPGRARQILPYKYFRKRSGFADQPCYVFRLIMADFQDQDALFSPDDPAPG